MILQNKIALVTGASKGIGASIAKHLAAAGATVVVNYATSQEGADRVVSAIQAAQGQAVALQGDFSKEEDIAQSFAFIQNTYGKLDILVNNAAVFKFNALETINAQEFHRHFDLNVLGLLLATQAAVRLMGPDGGSIINIGSVVASMSPARSSVYAGTKGAVDSITTALSKELGPRRIRVNSLAPGGVTTEGTSKRAATADTFAEFVQRTPLGRIGEPEDIAKIVVFLASPDSYWLTGQHILAAGGMTM